MNKPSAETRRQDEIRSLSLDGTPLNTKFGWLNRSRATPKQRISETPFPECRDARYVTITQQREIGAWRL